MFTRKLKALEYQNPANFDCNNEQSFRNLVIWLEDQKIRHMKIDDRKALGDTSSADWDKAYEEYLMNLGCEYDYKKRNSCLDWLLGQAVRCEYGDNVEKYSTHKASNGQSAPEKDNPFDNLDFHSKEFKSGVASLAELLNIPPHPDHLVVLRAICQLVAERLSPEAIEKSKSAEKMNKDKTIDMEQMVLGFQAGDYITEEAAKILRLLHIKELRELQTKINEAIVNVQKITADPKTDTRLGKVGR